MYEGAVVRHPLASDNMDGAAEGHTGVLPAVPDALVCSPLNYQAALVAIKQIGYEKF